MNIQAIISARKHRAKGFILPYMKRLSVVFNKPRIAVFSRVDNGSFPLQALIFDDQDAAAYYNRAVCGIELEDWDAVKADMAMVVQLNQDAELTAVAERVLTQLNGVSTETEDAAAVVSE